MIQSQTMQQATNDVSQMGTEELVEDELQVGGFSGYWSFLRRGTAGLGFSTLAIPLVAA